MLALGQKAAYFAGTPPLSSIVVECGGLLRLRRRPPAGPADGGGLSARKGTPGPLIQMKGLGCGCCVMRQTASIISTYAADVSGVCSALYRAGGHDRHARRLGLQLHLQHPRRAAVVRHGQHGATSPALSGAGGGDGGRRGSWSGDVGGGWPGSCTPPSSPWPGTPIPMVIGTDFAAVAALIEQRTRHPHLGLCHQRDALLPVRGLPWPLPGWPGASAWGRPGRGERSLCANLLGRDASGLLRQRHLWWASQRRRLEAERHRGGLVLGHGRAAWRVAATGRGRRRVNLVVSWCGTWRRPGLLTARGSARPMWRASPVGGEPSPMRWSEETPGSAARDGGGRGCL